MGWFSSSKECDDNGGHDQRPHERTESDGSKSTVVDCQGCGKEWKYDSKGRRK
jgi:RNase P subunit RPR2